MKRENRDENRGRKEEREGGRKEVLKHTKWPPISKAHKRTEGKRR